VYGIYRPHSGLHTTHHIDHIVHNIHMFQGDMNDGASLTRILSHIQHTHFAEPCDGKRLEIYNLAAQSHVHVSFSMPEYTAMTNAIGILKLLDSVRVLGMVAYTRVYQASTSEMFGFVQEVPQKETTPFYPRSPYGVAKVCGHWILKNYRESYGIFACSGILFNHESPRRGTTFVTRKITMGIANIMKGKQQYIELGNIYAKRDWGHAKDYVYGMWLMLQHHTPDDYILSSGEQHSVKEFVDIAFRIVGVHIRWEGEGMDEKGYDDATNELRVRIHPDYYRPCEVDTLLGDCSKATSQLGWSRHHTFQDLIKEMMEHDMVS